MAEKWKAKKTDFRNPINRTHHPRGLHALGGQVRPPAVNIEQILITSALCGALCSSREGVCRLLPGNFRWRWAKWVPWGGGGASNGISISTRGESLKVYYLPTIRYSLVSLALPIRSLLTVDFIDDRYPEFTGDLLFKVLSVLENFYSTLQAL